MNIVSSGQDYAVRVYQSKILGKHDSSLFYERFTTKQHATETLQEVDRMTTHILSPFILFPPMFSTAGENIILKYSETLFIIALQSGPMVPILIGSQVSLDDLCVLYKDRSEKPLITKQSASLLLL
jgi:hypothetical protein